MEPHQLEALIPVCKRRVPDRMNEHIMVINGFGWVKFRLIRIDLRVRIGHFDRGTGSRTEQHGADRIHPTTGLKLLSVPSKIFLTRLGSFVSIPVLQKDTEYFIMQWSLFRTPLCLFRPAYTDTVAHLAFA